MANKAPPAWFRYTVTIAIQVLATMLFIWVAKWMCDTDSERSFFISIITLGVLIGHILRPEQP